MRVLLIAILLPVVASADDVRRLTAGGLHFDALLSASSKEELTLEDRLSAARSAWALGLADAARIHWDDALANEALEGKERSKEQLARAILELQEGNVETARSIAERAAASIPSSDLRSQFWLLIAESLMSQGAISQAESYYQRAVAEAGPETKSEASFLLGECLLKLGRMSEARYSFAGVESRGRFAVPALKRLIEIDLNEKSYEGVLTWVHEGSENYPREFEEPWIRYAQTVAYLGLDRINEAKQELTRLKARHSENEPWFQLADATFEARVLKNNLKLGEQQ
jgi:tetratricopeptide (TPR) repeat protein